MLVPGLSWRQDDWASIAASTLPSQALFTVPSQGGARNCPSLDPGRKTPDRKELAMAETNGERWEGVENFNLDGAGEWLFVPPGLAHLTGSWQDYLRENSIALWRYWWEHWWLWPCDCCCCCCDETRP